MCSLKDMARGLAQQSQWAAALLDPACAVPDNVRHSAEARGQAGISVHRNNVIAGLVDGLAATFDVVQQLVGESFFRAMAVAFVRASPPRSPILAHYGSGLPDFIRGFEPASSLPYLGDVAQLEWLRQQALHAADLPPARQQATCRPISDCLQYDPFLQETGAVLHPSLRSLNAASAALSLWLAHQADDPAAELDELDWSPHEQVLVWRPHWEVLTAHVSPSTWAFVVALQAGLPLAGAERQALDQSPEFDVLATLTWMQRQGMLLGFSNLAKGLS